MPDPIRFLFVDDDEPILRALERLLMREGFDVTTTSRPASALALVAEKSIEVVVCDHTMPGMTGEKLLSEVREKHPRVVRVLASGSHDRSLIGVGVAHHFLDKPWTADELRGLLHEIARGVIADRA